MPRGHYAHVTQEQISIGRGLIADGASWSEASRRAGVAMETLKGALIPHYRERRTERIRDARHRRNGIKPKRNPVGRGMNGGSVKQMRKRAEKRREIAAKPPKPEPKQVDDIVRVKLVDLENDHCRFPIGNPADKSFGYCGLPEADMAAQRPYCVAHMKRCCIKASAPRNLYRMPKVPTKSWASFVQSRTTSH